MFPTNPATDGIQRLRLAVIGLICLATWALSHSYLGIFHDARLYTLQALSHLDDANLPQDVFLRYGSQDRFTIFTRIYAEACRWLGVESAAATLTLLSQFALAGSAFALARAVMPTTAALFGVSVLLAVPGDYGSDRIFTCFESFLTPRMAAEALALASLAAALSSRRLLAAILMLMAAMVHPVMAAAGIAALFFLYVAMPRPRLAVALAAVGLVLMIADACVTPTGPWGRFDPTWLELIENRSPFLFVARWDVEAWAPAAVSVTTIALAVDVLDNLAARALARITLITVLSGFCLALIAADLLHLVLFTQLQSWRWQWLGTITAALLLPPVMGKLWMTDLASRTTALLLIAGWAFASNLYALVAVSAALCSFAFLRRLRASEARWVFAGACGMLLIAVVWRLASNLEFTDAYQLDPKLPQWIRLSMSFARDGTAILALLGLLAWLGSTLGPTRRGRFALAIVGLMAVAVIGALIPQLWVSWTEHEYPQSQFVRFARFRSSIPPGTEVFWPENPVAVWLLLDRPSYLSAIQTAGMLFSRASAVELNRRAQLLSATIAPANFMDWSVGGGALSLSRQQLSGACASGGFGFLVTPVDLGVEPVAFIQSKTGPASKQLRLYRCGPP